MARKKKTTSVIRTRREWVEETLNDDEVRESGQQLARELSSIDDLEISKKGAMEEFKSAIAEHRIEVGRFSKEVRTEKRPLEVDVEDVLDGKKVSTVRVDTGEVLRVRHATPAELQGTLYGIDDEGESSHG